MSVDQDKLEAALRMLSIQNVRDVIYERDLNIKSRKKDELIDALLNDEWTDSEFESLLEWVRRLERESEPLGHYLAEISSIDTFSLDATGPEIREKFEADPVEFNGNDNLAEEGYKIKDVSEFEILGRYWTETTKYYIDPLGELQPRSRLYGTGFRLDLEENRVYVYAEIYGKAQGLLSDFQTKGINTDPIGHQDLANTEANRRMKAFVEDFKAEIDEIAEESDQDRLDGF